MLPWTLWKKSVRIDAHSHLLSAVIQYILIIPRAEFMESSEYEFMESSELGSSRIILLNLKLFPLELCRTKLAIICIQLDIWTYQKSIARRCIQRCS